MKGTTNVTSYQNGFRYSDGGRAEAGFKGKVGDCVCRAICHASGRPYAEVYKALAEGNANQRLTKHSKKRAGAGIATAAYGINTGRKWFKDYMASLGFKWVPTMQIGSGTKVHLSADELPLGNLVISVSKHYTAMCDGLILDLFDPRRPMIETTPDNPEPRVIETRAVYGYWYIPT